MREHIDLADLYRKACDQVVLSEDESGQPTLLSAVCPVTLDDMLACDIKKLTCIVADATRDGS
jgi:hypothetical protein